MKVLVTYMLDEELQIYSAKIEGVPVYGEGKTKDDALQDLRRGLEVFVEEEGKQALSNYLVGTTQYEELELTSLV